MWSKLLLSEMKEKISSHWDCVCMLNTKPALNHCVSVEAESLNLLWYSSIKYIYIERHLIWKIMCKGRQVPDCGFYVLRSIQIADKMILVLVNVAQHEHWICAVWLWSTAFISFIGIMFLGLFSGNFCYLFQVFPCYLKNISRTMKNEAQIL